jgi:hypothetical protein
MSMGRYSGSVRSAVGVNRVLAGFIAIYVSIAAVSFAAVWTLGSRLPVDAGGGASLSLEAELITIATYLALIALRHRHRLEFALETVLPTGLALLGLWAATLAATLWLNLDATVFRMPLASAPGIALIVSGWLAGLVLGKYLGGLAASSRLRREAATSRRSAWFAETSTDRSWRRVTGVTYGLMTLPLILVLQASSWEFVPGSFLPLQLVLAGGWAFAVGVGDHATISISDTGVKVRTRLPSNAGWSVPLSEIAGAEVVAARPERLNIDRRRIVLRTGPALEIKTVAGDRYSVSLDEADEAVAVIEALRSGAPPDVSEAEDSGSEPWSATR